MVKFISIFFTQIDYFDIMYWEQGTESYIHVLPKKAQFDLISLHNFMNRYEFTKT